jgi:hypothetical protein
MAADPDVVKAIITAGGLLGAGSLWSVSARRRPLRAISGAMSTAGSP